MDKGTYTPKTKRKTLFKINDLLIERNQLFEKLMALLTALEVKEIDELMTKTPEHFTKLGEIIKDGTVNIIMERDQLKLENDQLKEDNKRLQALNDLATQFRVSIDYLFKQRKKLYRPLNIQKG